MLQHLFKVGEAKLLWLVESMVRHRNGHIFANRMVVVMMVKLLLLLLLLMLLLQHGPIARLSIHLMIQYVWVVMVMMKRPLLMLLRLLWLLRLGLIPHEEIAAVSILLLHGVDVGVDGVFSPPQPHR